MECMRPRPRLQRAAVGAPSVRNRSLSSRSSMPSLSRSSIPSLLHQPHADFLHALRSYHVLESEVWRRLGGPPHRSCQMTHPLASIPISGGPADIRRQRARLRPRGAAGFPPGTGQTHMVRSGRRGPRIEIGGFWSLITRVCPKRSTNTSTLPQGRSAPTSLSDSRSVHDRWFTPSPKRVVAPSHERATPLRCGAQCLSQPNALVFRSPRTAAIRVAAMIGLPPSFAQTGWHVYTRLFRREPQRPPLLYVRPRNLDRWLSPYPSTHAVK